MTSSQPGPIDVGDDVAATVKKLDEAVEMAAHWTAIAEGLKGQLRERLGTGSYAIAGTPAFSISTTRRFNADHARAVLTPEQIAMCTEPVLSAELVKRRLGEDIYSVCQVEAGKPTVRRAS